MTVKEVITKKDWNYFLHLPFSIYSSDPYWVPPLISEQKKILNREKNPFFKHSVYKAWIISDGAKTVGRILGYIDSVYNDINNCRSGFLGFFECIYDQKAAAMLFETVINWMLQNNIQVVYGPMNFSIGNECGVQLTGYDDPPFIQMNHTPPYYQILFEQSGFTKAHDLYAYLMTDEDVKRQERYLKQLERVCDKAMQREGVALRTVNFKDYKNELHRIHALFNDCMDITWGFSPATFEEIVFASMPLKSIADKEMIFFAEVNGKPAGCCISVPDINQAIKHLKNGKLFPVGIFKLLFHIRKINRFRLFFMAVHTAYRFKGLDAMFYYYTIRKAIDRGYKAAELSWISEDNKNLISIVEKIGATRYKAFRVYQKKC